MKHPWPDHKPFGEIQQERLRQGLPPFPEPEGTPSGGWGLPPPKPKVPLWWGKGLVLTLWIAVWMGIGRMLYILFWG